MSNELLLILGFTELNPFMFVLNLVFLLTLIVAILIFSYVHAENKLRNYHSEIKEKRKVVDAKPN